MFEHAPDYPIRDLYNLFVSILCSTNSLFPSSSKSYGNLLPIIPPTKQHLITSQYLRRLTIQRPEAQDGVRQEV